MDYDANTNVDTVSFKCVYSQVWQVQKNHLKLKEKPSSSPVYVKHINIILLYSWDNQRILTNGVAYEARNLTSANVFDSEIPNQRVFQSYVHIRWIKNYIFCTKQEFITAHVLFTLHKSNESSHRQSQQQI